jgi:hypothetical protein
MVDRLSFMPNLTPEYESPSGTGYSIARVNPFIFLYTVDLKNKKVVIETGYYMGQD